MYNKELAFKNHDNGMLVAQMLLKEGYVVMLSLEEDLLIINYEWSERDANRNDVVFMSRYDFEEKYCEIIKEEN